MSKLTHREAQGYSPHPQTAATDLLSCLEICMECPPLSRRRRSVHINLFPTRTKYKLHCYAKYGICSGDNCSEDKITIMLNLIPS